MISNLLISVLATPGMALPPAPVNPLLSPVSVGTTVVEDGDAAKAIAAAGEDVAKLLELADAWKKEGKKAEAKLAWNRVIEIDENNETARKGLRHQFYDGKWFKSYSAMSKYRRAEAKRMAEQGFSRYNDEWVKTTDLPYLRMGWAKDAQGNWADPYNIAQAEHEAKMIAEGRQLRPEDSCWVHPDDFDKWSEGKWKIGEEWVSVEEANKHRAQTGQWWRARTDHFDTLTTCDYDVMMNARHVPEVAYPDLVRLYGKQPTRRPEVVVFRSMEQYNLFASGSQELQQQPAEASGFSSLHYAYFADAWYDVVSQPPRFLGTGVAYWDNSEPNIAAFGPFSIRHAAGLAYAEAITPSINTISAAIAGGTPPDLAAFWAEKPIPRWMFYGGAAYVDRFIIDKQAEDTNWIRTWTASGLRKGGELDSLETILAFDLSLDRLDASTRLIFEAGLVVAFILDGGCEPVIEKHKLYKAALTRRPEKAAEAAQELQAALIANEGAFKEFFKGL